MKLKNLMTRPDGGITLFQSILIQLLVIFAFYTLYLCLFEGLRL